MNKQQFQRELEYGATLSIATLMLLRHLITPNEFRKLKAALIKKHHPVISSLKETDPGNFYPKQVILFHKTVKTVPWNKDRKK